MYKFGPSSSSSSAANPASRSVSRKEDQGYQVLKLKKGNKSTAGKGGMKGTEIVKKKERFWAAVGGKPTLLRQPAYRSFKTLLSIAETQMQSATTFTNSVFSYQLANMLGQADYVAVFDSFRILEVEVVIRPSVTTGTSSVQTPTVYTVIDYDDVSALTTAAAFREYSNLEMTQYETVVRKFVPTVQDVALNNGGSLTGYNTVFAPWIDCGTPSVDHFGFKIGMDACATNMYQNLDINTRFLVEFRCTR
jgi:hypothetical protein